VRILEEDKAWIYFFWSFGVYAVYYFVPFDINAPMYSPYPFSSQKVTIATYAHYACGYVSRLLFVMTLRAFLPQFWKTWRIAFIVLSLSAANYILRYGESFFSESFDMMTVIIIVIGCVCLQRIRDNHRNKKYEIT